MANELLIRTMKDDMAEIDSAPKVMPAPSQQPVEEKTVVHADTIITPKSTFRGKAKFLVYGIVFFAILGAGYYGYIKWGDMQVLPAGTNTEVAFHQLIPSEALALIHYSYSSEENRNIVRQMWSNAGGGEDASALSGNPTSLLSIADVSQLYYLLMPGIQSPFLILENTEKTKEYLAQYREEQILKNGKWYIVHESKLEDYKAAIVVGTSSEDSSLLASTDSSSYVARYALSATFASRQFPSAAATATGLSKVGALVFHVTGSENDDIIRASALIAGEPPGEGVVEDTAELLTLIPNDISFGRVGFNFAEDLAFLNSDTAQFDTTVLSQPAVRQFLEQFRTPYALFERKGSDGVPDVGFIIALPAGLKQQVKIGDVSVEQSLQALIPLFIGKTLGIQVIFSDGEYKKTPLRYVNLVGQTQALDYAAGDNFLLVSSSREGMNALIETSLSEKKGVFMEDPLQGLSEKAAEIIKDRLFVVGSLTDASLLGLLPVARGVSQLPVIISSGKTSTGVNIQLMLSTK